VEPPDRPSTAHERSWRIFVSYSHKDEEQKNRIRTALGQLIEQHHISLWDDRQILPGSVWDAQITRKLEEADIFLILLSPDFLASAQCRREAQNALELHRKDHRPLIPVLLRPCDFEATELAHFQALPTDARPITRWPDADLAYLDVCVGLRKLVQEYTAQKPRIEAEATAKLLGLSTADADALVAGIDENGECYAEALRNLGELTRQDQARVRELLAEKNSLVSIVPYTHISDGLLSEQRKLQMFLATEGLHADQEFGSIDYGSLTFSLAAESSVFHLFPFFWAPSRRRHWGVIPYAQQKTIGILMHRTHPVARLVETFKTTTVTPGLHRVPIHSIETIAAADEWIKQCILITAELSGKVFWINGYVQMEVLRAILLRCADPRAIAALGRTQVLASPDDRERLFFYRLRGRKKRPAPDNQPTTSLFIFDPGEQMNVLKNVDPDYEAVVCNHGVNIPVGVGFSLHLLPALARARRWRHIREFALKTMRPHCDVLQHLGIELNIQGIDDSSSVV
jgi:hypothetical protein